MDWQEHLRQLSAEGDTLQQKLSSVWQSSGEWPNAHTSDKVAMSIVASHDYSSVSASSDDLLQWPTEPIQQLGPAEQIGLTGKPAQLLDMMVRCKKRKAVDVAKAFWAEDKNGQPYTNKVLLAKLQGLKNELHNQLSRRRCKRWQLSVKGEYLNCAELEKN